MREAVTIVTSGVTVTHRDGENLPGALAHAQVVTPLGLELTSEGVGPKTNPYPVKLKTGIQITDRRGERFGRLVIAEYAHDLPLAKRGWRCRCDCGEMRVLKYAMLTSGNTKSCGCLRRDRNAERNAANALPLGEASFRGLLGHYLRNARKRHFVFDLTEEQFRALTKQACHYCGLPPVRAYLDNPSANGPYVCNGVDRVENALGYTEANSVACCIDCNMAKGSMPAARWLAMIDRLAAHRIASLDWIEGRKG